MKTQKLTIACISDTHGYHRHIEEMPEADILIHSGDITRHGELDALKDFNDWLGELPYSHKIVIAGNHEVGFPENPLIPASLLTNAHYLYDSFIKVKGFKIWGSPYTPEFGTWAFTKKRHEMMSHWLTMPNDADIVVTHGPPFGVLDRNGQGYPCGCEALATRIQIVKPLLHVYGHIHDSYGETMANGTHFVNASYMGGSISYGTNNKAIVVEVYK